MQLPNSFNSLGLEEIGMNLTRYRKLCNFSYAIACFVYFEVVLMKNMLGLDEALLPHIVFL